MLGTHDEALLEAFSVEVLRRGGSILRDGDCVVGVPPWAGSAVWLRLAGEETVYGFGYAARDLLPLSDGYPTACVIDLLVAVMEGAARETFSPDGSPRGFQLTGKVSGREVVAEGADLITVPVPRWGR